MLLARERGEGGADLGQGDVAELDADREVELVALAHGLVGTVIGEVDVPVGEQVLGIVVEASVRVVQTGVPG